jgi:hypothetical protein
VQQGKIASQTAVLKQGVKLGRLLACGAAAASGIGGKCTGKLLLFLGEGVLTWVYRI